MNDHNHNTHGVNRRDFLRLGSTGAAGVALTGLGALNVSGQQAPATSATPDTNAAAAQQPPQISGKLPTRTLGKTGLQVGCIIGASDWSPDVIPLAIQSGVNYWHKANAWGGKVKFPEALKAQPRESYFLEVCLDRLSGYLAGPVGDADHFYNAVKASVKGLDIGYYDMMRFHYGHHSIDEVKSETGFVDAFNRLKGEGLVKHLSISQHNYSNGPVSPGGQTAYEILPYIMDNTPYEAAQFFYSYNGDSGRGASPREKVEELLTTCKAKNFGSIAMKTMAGVGRFLANQKDPTDPKNRIQPKEKDLFTALLADPKYAGTTPGSAIVKWVMSNPNLDAATICISNFDQLQENFKAAMNPAMTEQDHNMLKLVHAFNHGTTCLLCADCATSCPEEIAIIDILRYERYAMDYHDLAKAKAEYMTLSKNGTSCIACGDCLATPTCSNDINIMSKLKEVHTLLSS
jgi:predicted aldo/keto reductase-like oxidoreductase